MHVAGWVLCEINERLAETGRLAESPKPESPKLGGLFDLGEELSY